MAEKPADPAEQQTLEAIQRNAAATIQLTEILSLRALAETVAVESPLKQQEEDAKHRQAIAEADKAAAAARRDQFTAMIPDFSTVKDSTLTVADGGPAIGESALSYGALEIVAQHIATKISAEKDWNILVTGEQDLASLDAQAREIEWDLERLEATAEQLLKDTKPKKLPDPPPPVTDDASAAIETKTSLVPGGVAFAAEPLIGAIASAIPPILSLFSAQRSLKSSTVTIADLAAAAEVAQAIRTANPAEAPHLVFDEYRLINTSKIFEDVRDLDDQHRLLRSRKIELTGRATELAALLKTAKAELAAREKALKALKDTDKKRQNLEPDKAAWEQYVNDLETITAGLSAGQAMIDALLTTIDEFNVAIRLVPTGGKRSPLGMAALIEGLRHEEGKPARFSHVLLVKAQPGQATQVIDNRPLFWADRFATVVDISVTFALMETSSSYILSSGTVTGRMQGNGEIGKEITFKPKLAQ